MVDTIFPTPNTYAARQGRQTQAPAFAGATAARPLGALTGVRPGTPANTVTATTSLVTVQPFGGVADVQTLASAGPYTFAFDAVYTVALAAQSASVARSDIVYVQLADNQEDGTGAVNSSSATRVYQAGTTVTIPTPPNTRTFIIAVINVPITGSAPTVTWVAQYAVAAGATIPYTTQALMNAAPGSWVGQRAEVYADSTAGNNMTYRWNGSAWKAWDSDWITYTPSLSATSGGFGSAAATGFYKYSAGAVTVTINALISSVGTAAGQIVATLPVQAAFAAILSGKEVALGGVALSGEIVASGSTVSIVNYVSGSIIGAGARAIVTGTYRVV